MYTGYKQEFENLRYSNYLKNLLPKIKFTAN